MICEKCGKNNPDVAAFCRFCGNPLQNAAGAAAYGANLGEAHTDSSRNAPASNYYPASNSSRNAPVSTGTHRFRSMILLRILPGTHRFRSMILLRILPGTHRFRSMILLRITAKDVSLQPMQG